MYVRPDGIEGVTALPYRGRRALDGTPLAMTSEQLIGIARYLYGDEWTGALAREIGMEAGKLREMGKDRRRVPQRLAQYLLDRMAEDREYVEAAHAIAEEAAAQLASFVRATAE